MNKYVLLLAPEAQRVERRDDPPHLLVGVEGGQLAQFPQVFAANLFVLLAGAFIDLVVG